MGQLLFAILDFKKLGAIGTLEATLIVYFVTLEMLVKSVVNHVMVIDKLPLHGLSYPNIICL